MGRKPNALILKFFTRGPKLNDNSNRYPHKCNKCGETFPKGRLESLTNHLTKKCPAISAEDRFNACLELHGIQQSSQRPQKAGQNQPNGLSPSTDPAMMQRDWTALETLAEVSRQMDMSEHHDEPGQQAGSATPGLASNTALPQLHHLNDRFELQEQFTLDNPPVSYENRSQRDRKGGAKTSVDLRRELSAEDKVHLLRSAEPPSVPSALSVAAAATAAAATARLDPDALDPQLLREDTEFNNTQESSPSQPETPSASASASQPWGEITYLTEHVQPPTLKVDQPPVAPVLNRGGVRMETRGGPNGGKSRHSRARFDSTRRKEVQEVRRVGACIRCRILRKTCSTGTPCETCRKVFSPRIWTSGCKREKLSELLNLYSAGVQVVRAQRRINELKDRSRLSNNGIVIEASHFPETGVSMTLEVLQHAPDQDGDISMDPSLSQAGSANARVVMLDGDREDIPGKVEAYMHQMLPELIQREPSPFTRATLETAMHLSRHTDDELLRKSLELWGLAEVLDREPQWIIAIKKHNGDGELHYINEETDQDTFQTIYFQLAAAAERKAAATSKTLLTGMQRVLQDSKTKVGFNMYFTTLVLLNCIEKTTWAFKAWGQVNLRENWPLEKNPEEFTDKGFEIAVLLKMLLSIRKALPRIVWREADDMLLTEEQDEALQRYFQIIQLRFQQLPHVQLKTQHNIDFNDKDARPRALQQLFCPTDSRSFEQLFCSTLLVPGQE